MTLPFRTMSSVYFLFIRKSYREVRRGREREIEREEKERNHLSNDPFQMTTWARLCQVKPTRLELFSSVSFRCRSPTTQAIYNCFHRQIQGAGLEVELGLYQAPIWNVSISDGGLSYYATALVPNFM